MSPFRETWYLLLAFAMLTVALFGKVNATRYGYLWDFTTVGFYVGTLASLWSLFRRHLFYLQAALMAFPFFARGSLYLSTPESLPGHNEWAAGVLNLLIGISTVVILSATWVDD